MFKKSGVFLKILLLAGISNVMFNMSSMEISKENEVEGIASRIDLASPNCYLELLADKNITPENTVFAFDFHEVLFDRHKSEIVWRSFKLLCKCFLYLVTNPSFLPRLIELQKQYTIFEGVNAQLVKEYPFWGQFKSDILEISNSPCYPIESMINLVKTLKEKGFKIFMLSNMGLETWEDFSVRFSSITELFDGYYTPNKDNNYLGKPEIEFYEEFKNYLTSVKCGDKQILFIDDIQENITGALKSGIAAIHFTGYANLCKSLAELDVIVEE